MAVSFLVGLWISFPDRVEAKEETATMIVKILKSGIREGSKLQKFAALSQLFRLLAVFSETLNSYAPILYKILTFSIVENHADSEIREFFLVNFIQLFEKVPKIPVGVVIEPLVKQIHVSDDTTYVYNTFDFDFFISVSRHPRLSVKHGVQLMDVLGKIYLNDFHYFRAAGIAFMLIAHRHAEAAGM